MRQEKMKKIIERNARETRFKNEFYIFEESAEVVAEEKGLKVIYPKNNELFIDIDDEDQLDGFERRINDLLETFENNFFNGLDIIKKVSSSGAPHYHIVVSLYKDDEAIVLNDWQRVCLQFLLCSDPIKETLSVYRILAGVKNPSILFEKKED